MKQTYNWVRRVRKWAWNKSVRTRAKRILRAHAGAEHWNARIADAVACPDNAHIPRVEGAGTAREGVITMHNGIRVAQGSYYGLHMDRLLARNRGVHEPQEERVFQAVLPLMPERPVMVEAGAYWSFYSLWMLQERPAGPLLVG